MVGTHLVNMKHYKVFLFATLVIFNSVKVLGQSVLVRAIIKDGATKSPLAYAMVYSTKAQTGKYSDENGLLEWNLSRNDSITVSFLAYESQKLAVNSLQGVQEILLSPTAYELNTVTVKSNKKRKRTYQIGFYEDPTHFDASGVGIGNIVVNYIRNNTGENSLVKSLLFDTGKARNHPHRALARVRIFAADNPQAGPGKDILRENVVFQISKFGHKIKVDLTPYQVVFPQEGFFIGFEFLGYETRKGLVNQWKIQTGAMVTSTKRSDYKSVGASWKFPDSGGNRRWMQLTDGSQHKAWERILYKIGAEVESL